MRVIKMLLLFLHEKINYTSSMFRYNKQDNSQDIFFLVSRTLVPHQSTLTRFSKAARGVKE